MTDGRRGFEPGLGQAILWASVIIAAAIVLSDTPGAFARILPILAGGAGGSIAIGGRRSPGRCRPRITEHHAE